ncbi:MAG: transglutaminase domain-containing protein [Clostridia bacterium]|nr:transglutaminase domain-containing protein [Clostridia bacterium]
MKTSFFSIPKGLALRAVTAICIGFGCTWPLLLAMDLVSSAALCASCCAFVALLYAVFDCMPRLRSAVYPLLFAALCCTVWPYRSQLQAFSHALTLFVNGQPLALAAYSRVITAILAAVLTSFGASLARSDHAFFPLAFLTVFELMIVSLLGLHADTASIVPLLAALLLCARAPGVSSFRLLPMGAAALAITLAFLPVSSSVVPSLHAFAESVRQTIDDYFFFTEPRIAFSLSQTGYQPFGQERLGGTAFPTDEPVMEVKTPQRALLRATVKNEYTGLAWADTASGRRYLFISPRFSSLRNDLFDQSRPPQSALLPGSRTLSVTMRADAASTLFLTQRFTSPSGRGIVSYFSPSSEVFATRSLHRGDSYTFSGRLLDASGEGVRNAVLASLDPSDPYYDTVKSVYLQLPASVEQQVYEIASELTESYSNDFDRAAAICLYLQRGFSYSLMQNEPPLTRDFVSWFLLEEKRGYCTAFASSMTVLARAAGLPARYVEGYAALPDSDGVARVIQRDAHAWTEVYFPGFGWLTFDPTPGIGSAPDYGGSNTSSDDPERQPQDAPSGNDPPPEDTPTPAPTPAPTPSPSPTPAHSDPAVTPTPEITPAPTPAPTPSPTSTPSAPPPADDDHSDPSSLLLALLALVVLILLIALRFALTSPARIAALYRNPGDQLLIWYIACRQALSAMGLPLRPGEAPATYLLRCQEALNGRITLIKLGKALCMARYAGRRLKPVTSKKAESIYRAVYALLTPAQRIRLHVHRFIHGISFKGE